MQARLLRWSAWAPGLESPDAWAAWAAAPRALDPDGHPDAKFLPAMLRRRCTPLSRIVLTAAFGATSEDERAEVRTVFASRHGSVNESIDLLGQIVRSERMSPARFSHSVHNAQAGLFCIAAGNQQASSSLAGREDTFAAGWLEALGHLEREPTRRVLYVMGDVKLAPEFARLVPEPPASYAVALLLAAGGDDGDPIRFGAANGDARRDDPPWPHAAEFVRWLAGSDDALVLRGWRWSRG